MQQENEEEKGGTLGHLEERPQRWNRRHHYRNQMNQMRKMKGGNRSWRGGAKKIRVREPRLVGDLLPHQ